MRRGQRGFTLIEVLVAMFVLAIGLLGLASMQLNASRANANSGKTTRAVMIAQERMELLRSAPFAEVSDASSNAMVNCGADVQIKNTSGTAIDYYEVTCTFTNNTANCPAELVCLQVQVDYPEAVTPVTQISLRSTEGGVT